MPEQPKQMLVILMLLGIISMFQSPLVNGQAPAQMAPTRTAPRGDVASPSKTESVMDRLDRVQQGIKEKLKRVLGTRRQAPPAVQHADVDWDRGTNEAVDYQQIDRYGNVNEQAATFDSTNADEGLYRRAQLLPVYSTTSQTPDAYQPSRQFQPMAVIRESPLPVSISSQNGPNGSPAPSPGGSIFAQAEITATEHAIRLTEENALWKTRIAAIQAENRGLRERVNETEQLLRQSGSAIESARQELDDLDNSKSQAEQELAKL